MYRAIFVMLNFLLLFGCNTIVKSQNTKFENFGDVSSITKPDLQKWQQVRSDFNFVPVNVNTRVTYNQYPVISQSNSIQLQGWIGEIADAQVVISSKRNINSLNVSVTDLVAANGNIIDSKYTDAGYVYYVKADNSVGVCQKQNNKYPDIIVPDIINFRANTSFVKAYTNRPVWIKIRIPNNAQPGLYKGKINATVNGAVRSIDISVRVSNNKMPAYANRKFFLELWQYPIAEADYYKVKPWSDEHFRLMKPAMEELHKAGESVITASFFWDMFNTTTRDANDMFIKVTKTKAGTYTYDFTNFDKWVNFMMDIGINKQITVFGMATLNYRLYYFDEATNSVTYIQYGVREDQYKQFWTQYLNAFEAHLKEKNWFNITTLGFSEKEMDVSVPLIKFIKGLDRNWKISFSGKYYPVIQDAIYDYSVISNQVVPDSIITARRNKGYITSFYTSCWERFPNTFVMSDPIDATWLAWNAVKRNMDGYLRWAYDFWTASDMLTNVTTNVASGDNFFIYPDGCTSIRFEMLREGIEDFEKIQVKKNQQNFSPQLNSALSEFDFKKVNIIPSRFKQVQDARALLR